jgi:hypothetical protein
MKRGPISEKASRHMARVKELPCCCCGASGPSHAHHILQGRTPGRRAPDWLTIPVCDDCHVGSHNGIHAMHRMWDVMKLSEFEALDATLEKLYGHLR